MQYNHVDNIYLDMLLGGSTTDNFLWMKTWYQWGFSDFIKQLKSRNFNKSITISVPFTQN